MGGQRPRNNNFTVEGIDDNDKSVTGPLITVPNDATGEFTLLTNQFSPEFGHSTGGQFNTTILGGTNQLHGRVYEYFQNRNLNAIDASTARGQDPAHIVNPRYRPEPFWRPGGWSDLQGQAVLLLELREVPVGTEPGVRAVHADRSRIRDDCRYARLVGQQPGDSAKVCSGVGDARHCWSGLRVADDQRWRQRCAGGSAAIFRSVLHEHYQSTSSIDYTKSQNNQFRFRYMYLRDASTDTAANLADSGSRFRTGITFSPQAGSTSSRRN